MIGTVILSIIILGLMFYSFNLKSKLTQYQSLLQELKAKQDKELMKLWKIRFKAFLKYYKQMKKDGFPDSFIESKFPDTTDF